MDLLRVIDRRHREAHFHFCCLICRYQFLPVRIRLSQELFVSVAISAF